MNKLFVIDAYALIFRSYYAFLQRPITNSKGWNTSAIMGFFNTVSEILEKEQPTHLAVAFDKGKTFRHTIFPEYKAQRQETPEDIIFSVPWIKRVLEALHIPVYEVEGYEADDIIGTISVAATQQGFKTFMLTPDKDYGQLVSDHVVMYKPQNGGYTIIDTQAVKELYGFDDPKKVIDILALMGDSADNYPGCPGVGAVTAKKLIQEFGSVENLLQNTEKLKGKQREKVEKAHDDILLSKQLATIKTDVPMHIAFDDMAVRQPNAEKLTQIFGELEFNRLLRKFLPQKTSSPSNKQDPSMFPGLFAEESTSGNSDKRTSTANRENLSPNHSLSADNKEQVESNTEKTAFITDVFPTNRQECAENTSFTSIKNTAHKYQLIDSEEEIQRFCDFLQTKSSFSIDTETTGIDALEAELVGMSFATEEFEAYYIPFPREREKTLERLNLLKPIIENTETEKIGQNLKYDMTVLENYGIRMGGTLFDTMIAHYVIQPELKHNMDDMAEQLLHYRTVHIEELIGEKGKNQRNMADLSPEEVYEYACEDADVTLRLKNILEKKLQEVGAEKVFYEIEMPLVPVLIAMERQGVRLDTDTLQDTAKIFQHQLAEYEQKVYAEAGERFNISSPKQVGEILFSPEKMNILEKPKKTKSGQYVTSEEVLRSIEGKAPIVEYILRYRGLKKLLSTYIEALPKLIRHTGRIHSSFNQTQTATGRLSSSDPNLQNIPVRSEEGKEIRKCFVPEPGCLFFSADYSQIELRIMAHLSGDRHMIEAFASGQDIHRATAAKIWHIPIEEVTDEQRKKAKQANFGIIYGISAFGLAQRMNIDRREASNLIKDYFATFPQVKAYMDKAIEDAKQRGWVETMYGRRRYLPDINSRNATVRNFAERNAINAPIQGSEADIIKLAMIRIFKRFEAENIQSKMILQVHDELNFSVLPEEKEQVERIVIEEMQSVCRLNVPLTADAGWGNNWLEAH